MLAILIGLAGALVIEAWKIGVTVDEPSHLVSAYLYWQGKDRLEPRDMPPLIKIVGGWVPNLFHLPLPADLGYKHETRHEWNVSADMIDKMSGPEMQRVFSYSRMPFAIFPLLTATLIWFWARQLFRPPVAVLLMLAYALSPTALAHGALFKNDIAATFTYLWFWYCAWKFWREPNRKRAAWLGVSTFLGAISKMSMLFLICAAPSVVLLRYLTRRKLGLRATAAALLLVLLIPYAGVLAACQFETRRIPAAEWSALVRDPSLPKPFVAAAAVFRVLPLPVPMWHGTVALFRNNADPVRVYLLGNIYKRGTIFYFPVALAVKVPIPVQLLLLGGVILMVIRVRRGLWTGADILWLLPGFLYIGLASLSALQLGVRLVLPALPFGLFLCGVALEWLWKVQGPAIPAALLVWLAVQSAIIFPHGISFFNLWVGGPKNGLRYLADSNVDWGQDLPALADYVKEHGINKLKLSYFGNDKPFRFFRENQLEVIAPPWSDDLTGGHVRLKPEPGYYAISANLLPGHFFERKYRDFYRAFRDRQPIATAGYSIYIYRIPSDVAVGKSGVAAPPAR